MSTKGIVVEHKLTKIRYAIVESSFNGEVHTKVRDLRPEESVFSYQPKAAPLVLPKSSRPNSTVANGRGQHTRKGK